MAAFPSLPVLSLGLLLPLPRLWGILTSLGLWWHPPASRLRSVPLRFLRRGQSSGWLVSETHLGSQVSPCMTQKPSLIPAHHLSAFIFPALWQMVLPRLSSPKPRVQAGTSKDTGNIFLLHSQLDRRHYPAPRVPDRVSPCSKNPPQPWPPLLDAWRREQSLPLLGLPIHLPEQGH